MSEKKNEVNKEALKKWLTVFKLHDKATKKLDETFSQLFGKEWFTGPLGEYIATMDDMFLSLLAETVGCSNVDEMMWLISESDNDIT